MSGNACTSAVVSPSVNAGVHGRICGIAGLQDPVVVVWVQTEAGEGLPVLFDQRGFWDVVSRRGAETLSGRGVTCALRVDRLGDGRSLIFDDEQRN